MKLDARKLVNILGILLPPLLLAACRQGPQPVAPPTSFATSPGERVDPSLYRSSPEYWLLLSTRVFAGSAVGDGCNVSDEVTAFRLLLKKPYADVAFKDLLQNAGLPGQLYALCGLYFTDPNAFRSVVGKYCSMEEEIPTLFYCIGSTMKVSGLVCSKSPRAVRLDGPHDSIESWTRRQNWPQGLSVEHDIIGGGFPSDFQGL